MTAVLDQVKSVAYTSVGVNLVVTDAVVGRTVPTPEFAEPHAKQARKQGKKALKEFRARTEPRAVEFESRLPEQVGDRLASGRVKAWDFIGISAPKGAKAKSATDTAAEKATDIVESAS